MAERVEDLNLPNAVVTRIMKECLPEGISVGKEARTAVGRAASVFVLYLTSSANNAALHSSRKTITANDVFTALKDTNFEFFIEPLKQALEGFKKQQQDKKLKMASSKKKDTTEEEKAPEEEGTNSEDQPQAETSSTHLEATDPQVQHDEDDDDNIDQN